METLLVRLRGAPEKVLDQLINEGYFTTKSEVVRAGILELGKEYLSMSKLRQYRKHLQKAFAKKGYTAERLQKELEDMEA